MAIIDTHCHVGPSWYEPVESLLYHMDTNSVDHAVLIQHNGMFDNDYLLDCVAEHPDRLKAVVQVDPNDSTPSRTLAELADRGASGIRLPLHTPIADPELHPLWEKVDELDLTVSVQGRRPGDFLSERFTDILERCSNTTFVIEHLAALTPVDPPYRNVRDDFEAVLDLAAQSSMYIKIPGLGEICPKPETLENQLRFEYIPPELQMVTDRIGVENVMWGSDYPPCSAREGYGNTLEGLRTRTAFDDDQLRWIVGKTAQSVWDF